MSAQMYIARLIEEGRTDRGPHATFRRDPGLGAGDRGRSQHRSWRLRKGASA
jgi:hypothetical protein